MTSRTSASSSIRRAAGPCLPGKTGWSTIRPSSCSRRQTSFGKEEVCRAVSVQVADLPAADPECELAAPAGTGLDARPGRDLLGDLLARRSCLVHGSPLSLEA